MKKVIAYALSAAMLLSTLGPCAYAAEAADTLVIDPRYQRQTLEGWGTSLCWWGNAVGNWGDTAKEEEISSLLFDPQDGLGLNMVRYNIGGGENPGHNHMRVRADIPSYQPEAGTWDWTGDAGQLKVLKSAIGHGADILEAFTNAPPYWMTYSKCAAGSVTGLSNNLYDDAYDNFAEYVTDVMVYLKEAEGINFRTLSPVNEPSSTWWRQNNNQEGCHFDQGKQDLLICEMSDKLKQKGLSTQISALEEYNIDDSLKTFNAYSPDVKDYIAQINTHTYKGSNRSGLWQAAALAGNRLWVSEVGVGGTAPHSHEDMTSAMQLAQGIVSDIRDMGVDGWVYWQAVEDEAGNNNYGFIHANFVGSENYWVTKQYYVMANFSKFIRPGAIIIGTNDSNTLAAFNPKTNRLTVVLVNTGASGKDYQLDLSKFSALGDSMSVYRTSKTENCQQLASVSVDTSVVSLSAAANSITTVTLDGVQYSGYRSINDNDIGMRSNEFNYLGTWDYYNAQDGAFDRDNHYSSTKGASVELTFWGTGVKVYSAKANSHGIASIAVDGAAATTVDCYAVNRQDGVEIYSVSALTPGYHTVAMSVTGEKNPSATGTAVVADRIDVINESTQFSPQPPLPARESRNDIALGALASADSSQQGNAPQNAVDGNLESRWCANDGKTGHWMQTDLGYPADLTGFEITFGIPAQYKIEGSADGNQWSALYENTGFSGRRTQENSLNAGNVRYVRVTITKLQSGAWASIDDLKLYSDSFTVLNDNTTNPTQDYFKYSGNWQYNWYETNAYLQDNHYSNNAGDSYELTFTGSSVVLYTAQRPPATVPSASVWMAARLLTSTSIPVRDRIMQFSLKAPDSKVASIRLP